MPVADAGKLRPARMMGATYYKLLLRLRSRGWSSPRAPVRLSGGEKLLLALGSLMGK